VHVLAEEQHLCFLNSLMLQLAAEGIHLVRPEEMSDEQERFLDEFFDRALFPIVTPLAIDPGHPFPYLANRSLCLVVYLRSNSASRLPHTDLSIVHIPAQVTPRFIPLPGRDGQHGFMLLEDVLRHHLPRLTTVLQFPPVTPFASRATPISDCRAAMKIYWQPSSREFVRGAWAMR
jgi:polyphosphate kinase